MEPPAPLPSQTKIWSHFQNAAPESFAAAGPRLRRLVREVARRVGTARPAVLNVGIGDGTFERTARQRPDWEVHALDPDPQAVARLGAEGVVAAVGFLEAAPYDDGRFDAVVASEVLEHLDDATRAAAMKEVVRILRPGGWFLGTVPYREELAAGRTVCPCCGAVFHRWGHQAAFDEGRMRAELVAAGLAPQVVRRTVFPDFRGRGPAGIVKAIVRLGLAKLGEPIAVPSLFWSARKAGAPRG